MLWVAVGLCPTAVLGLCWRLHWYWWRHDMHCWRPWPAATLTTAVTTELIPAMVLSISVTVQHSSALHFMLPFLLMALMGSACIVTCSSQCRNTVSAGHNRLSAWSSQVSVGHSPTHISTVLGHSPNTTTQHSTLVLCTDFEFLEFRVFWISDFEKT